MTCERGASGGCRHVGALLLRVIGVMRVGRSVGDVRVRGRGLGRADWPIRAGMEIHVSIAGGMLASNDRD